MMTITHTADVQPPPGAEADLWLHDGYREVYNTVGVVVTSDDFMRCPMVTVIADQYRDGHLQNIAVEVDDAGHEPLTPSQAIELAQYITEAADVATKWAVTR